MARHRFWIVNDLHAGSTVALCPPRILLDDGGTYEASMIQRWLWQCWGDFWGIVERGKEPGDINVLVLNGDLVDGDHHNTPQILSRNPEAQAAVLSQSLAVPLALKPDRIFVVRGTEAHVGRSGSSEEGLARSLRNDGYPVEGDPRTGSASWWHLRMEVQGVYLDFAHHGRTGQREHTRGNAANLYAHDILLSYVKRGERHPDLAIRAHHHRFNDSNDASPVRVVTNGAWQLHTGWSHSKFADTMADIGGLIVTVENGEYSVRKIPFQAERGHVYRFDSENPEQT